MKRKLKVCLLALTMLMFLSIGFMAADTSVQAATPAYKSYDIYEGVTKVGNYYFKYYYSSSKHDYVVKMAKAKSGPYSATPMGICFVSNGQKAYYCKNNCLYKYDFAKKTATKLKTLSSAPAYSSVRFKVSSVYGGKIYITKGSFDAWKYTTYVYDVAAKTYKAVKSNCALHEKISDRAIGQNEYRTDASPYPISLYKFTSSGLTTIKKLTSCGWILNTVGNYFYYAVYPATATDPYSGYTYHTQNVANIYKLAYNSTTPKKLATIKTMYSEGSLQINKATSSYVEYYDSSLYASGKYRYYFSTGETIVLESN